jgi:transposase-like protein
VVKSGEGFTNPEFRGRFLEHVSLTGKSVAGACRHFGISPNSYQAYCRKNPDFRLDYEEARAASADHLLQVMREQGEMGDVASAALFLKHVAPPKQQRVEVQHEHKHELSVAPETILTINQLQAQLEQRALTRGGDYIDVDPVD